MDRPKPASGSHPPASSHARAAKPPVQSPTPEALVDARVEPDLVVIPARTVLALAGRGAPGDAAFQRSVGALHGITYGLKFARRAHGKGDFHIGPLEARWWNDAPDRPFLETPPATWRWCLRLGVPDDVTDAELAGVVQAAIGNKRGKLVGSVEAEEIALVRLPTERCARALHVGAYSDEKATFDRIFARLAAEGVAAAPRHAEIYLGDPTRTPPARLRTVLLVELA
jgi:hypothetical protein